MFTTPVWYYGTVHRYNAYADVPLVPEYGRTTVALARSLIDHIDRAATVAATVEATAGDGAAAAVTAATTAASAAAATHSDSSDLELLARSSDCYMTAV